MSRDFVDLFDLGSDDARQLLERAADLKREYVDGVRAPYLPGRTLGLLFEKPSLRTRVSFEAAIARLGGNAIFLHGKELAEIVPSCGRSRASRNRATTTGPTLSNRTCTRQRVKGDLNEAARCPNSPPRPPLRIQ